MLWSTSYRNSNFLLVFFEFSFPFCFRIKEIITYDIQRMPQKNQTYTTGPKQLFLKNTFSARKVIICGIFENRMEEYIWINN